MMKKKFLLAGIAGMALVFTLMLAGCPTDGGDGGGGGGDNPLLGTWVNDQDFANLNLILIFTDSPVTGPGIAENTKQAYYAQNLAGNSDYTTEGAEYKIPITGAANSPYTADIGTLASGKFSLTGYVAVTTDNATGKVDFKRAQGTSGSDLRGVWISDLPSGNAAFTIILIGGANGKKVWSATGAANVTSPSYRTTGDAGSPSISWNNSGNTSVYTKTTIGNIENLNIPLPAGGNNVDLKQLYTTPTF
jgi:hypothetical protein